MGRCLLECALDQAFDLYNCTPWNIPGPTYSMCDPLRAEQYLDYTSLPHVQKKCGHCLPDCEGTRYQAKVSSAPIRNCNHQNMGVSTLCKFDLSPNGISPQMWADQAIAVSD